MAVAVVTEVNPEDLEVLAVEVVIKTNLVVQVTHLAQVHHKVQMEVVRVCKLLDILLLVVEVEDLVEDQVQVPHQQKVVMEVVVHLVQ